MESRTMTRFSCDENRSVRRADRRSCNSQICFAYLLSVLAVILIVGGIYLSYYYWDKLWLIAAIFGIAVNLFGSYVYYSGNKKLCLRNEEHIYENRTRRRRYRTRGLSTDQLMPTAPPLSQSRSVSQLSLNMIPQYFCSNESEAISVTNQSISPSVSALTTYSQIFSVNGQSYLILPLTGEPLNASNSFPLQNLVVRVSEDNKLQTLNQKETNNETTGNTESKKIGREEQSCQTEAPVDLKRLNNGYRDVQMQTLSRTQLDQIDNQEVNSEAQCSQSFQAIQSTSAHNSNSFAIQMSSNACSSKDSSDNSLEPFGSEDTADTETVVTLIDLTDDNNDCSFSAPNRRSGHNFDTQTEENSSLIGASLNQTAIGVEDSLENDCFNSFSNENVAEEQIDECLSIPPPSYQDVIDYSDDNNDEQPIVVDYGTL